RLETCNQVTDVSDKQKSLLFFCFQLGMPKKDHASERLSRKAKRLDSRERRGTLSHASLKTFLLLFFPVFFSCYKLVVLGLDNRGSFFSTLSKGYATVRLLSSCSACRCDTSESPRQAICETRSFLACVFVAVDSIELAVQEL